MTQGREALDRLVRTVAAGDEPVETRRAAISRLRKMSLDAAESGWLMAIAENPDHPAGLRRCAIQTLGFHRPWRSLSLFHDDRIHPIPARLTALLTNLQEERPVREAVISAIGWQYLDEHNAWPALLSDPDPFLRRDALFELLRNPDRNAVEQMIRHLTTDRTPLVLNAILWGLARHPHFHDVSLTMLARTGGEVYVETVLDACRTDLTASARALLNADMKHFEIRERLIQSLFQPLDASRIACLLDLMAENERQFAVRTLRDADQAAAEEVIARLDQSVQTRQNAEWTEEAAKLVLSYWDRFEPLRQRIANLLGDWRPFSPRVAPLAMSRDIYW